MVVVALLGCRHVDEERQEGIVEEPAPAIAPTPAPVTQGPIGTAHPIAIISAAKNARWVVACQARIDTDGDGYIETKVGHHGDLYGDIARPYLIRGAGAGMAIQELVAVSPDERYLAIMRDGALVLVDDSTGRETTIADADLRPDQRGYSRIATFDAASKRLIYFRANAPGTLVIRDLAQSRERIVRMPSARAWRVVAEVGPWARFRFVRDDTNQNGTLDWPTVHTNAPVGDVCTGPAISYSTFGGGGDVVVDAWLDVEQATLTEDANVLAHLPRYTRWGVMYDQREALTRLHDGSFGVHLDPTTELEFIPASCNAQVGLVLPAPLRIAVVCGGKAGDRLPVEVFGPGFHAKLDVTSERRDEQRPPRIVSSSIFCVGDPCFDLATGKRIATRGAKVETFGSALLTRDGDHMYWMASPAATPLHVPNVDGYYANATAGSMIALDKGIVDLATGRVLGYAPGNRPGYAPKTPLAIDTRGRVLVAADDTQGGLPLGPLIWAEPLPQPPPSDD